MKHSPGFLKKVEKAKKNIRELTVEEVATKLKTDQNFYLVDVREESEYAAGHIRNAIHIGKGVLERDIEEKIPDPQTEIILYCGGGYRSALAAESIQDMGYKNVYSMDGGWRQWNEKDFPRE